MNVVKKVAMGVVAALVVLALGSFLLPSKVHVERTATIAAPPEQIYEYVGATKRWPEWVAWEPTKWEFPGAESGVGAESKWEDAQGGGHLKITAADPQKGIGYDLSFGGSEFIPGRIAFSPDGNGTKLVWEFDFETGWNPINRYFCSFALDRLVGADFEKGLAKLKKKVESESLPAEKSAAENPPASETTPAADQKKPSE